MGCEDEEYAEGVEEPGEGVDKVEPPGGVYLKERLINCLIG